MSASNEQLGDQAREQALQEIIQEEEQRLGKFTLGQTVEPVDECDIVSINN